MKNLGSIKLIGQAPYSVLVKSLFMFIEKKTEYSAFRVVALYAARSSALSPSNSGVVSPICCRKTTDIGHGGHQIGLIFWFFSIKGKEQEKNLWKAWLVTITSKPTGSNSHNLLQASEHF
jgi:hypothetical protein